MMKEEWKKVKDWPYEVSNIGRMRKKFRENPEYILKLQIDKDGYRRITMCHNRKRKHYFVHRLVLNAFKGPPPFLKAECRHLDGNRSNNYWQNLEWGTRKENCRDTILHGNSLCGEKNSKSCLTNQQVYEMIKRYEHLKQGRKRVPKGLLVALATEYGVNKRTIIRIYSAYKEHDLYEFRRYPSK